MSAAIAAMVTAVVGVLGTLSRDRYAEAQMIVPEAILDASRAVNTVLAAADAAAKRIDRGLTDSADAVERALNDLKAAEPRLTAMRRSMREDLGVLD